MQMYANSSASQSGGDEPQEYLGSSTAPRSSEPSRSRQQSYDEPNPVQSQIEHVPQGGQYLPQLTKTMSQASLANAGAGAHPVESPHALHPPTMGSPSASSSGEREEEHRSAAAEGLGLGRIAEPVQPVVQPRRGSAWMAGPQEEGVPTTFDEEVLRVLCDSDVSGRC